MRLIKLKLKDYRRFAGEQSLDLNETLIALVGPNEAGKSSILSALDLVGRLAMPSATDSTRGVSSRATLSALFVLEPDDRALLADIHDGNTVTHVWVDLIEGEVRSVWRPDPFPFRDLRPRRRCKGLIDGLEGDPGLDDAYSTGDEWRWDPDVFVHVKASLDSDAESLSQQDIASLEELGHRLRGIQYPVAADVYEGDAQVSEKDEQRAEARMSAASALIDLAEIERQPRPVRLVIDALAGRTPDVAFFRETDRDLESTYNLTDVATDPPPALRNLCALAELDLAGVQEDLGSGRVPHVEAVFEAANARLKARFRDTWRQSDVYPRLSTPLDGVMRIMVAVEGGTDYSFPEERSDGLRWFMALHAFLTARGEQEPILLVDEAETHLHYDAQADLVDALMSQRIARQVVYTTHSVGCLPPDLGCGIRVVLAAQDAERSRISNSYWSVDPDDDPKVGYTPLLFAMGARLLSLTIPRYGVVVEGPSDAILLPSLFREATGLPNLAYRIVPGLSDIADTDVSTLSHHAGKVVSLTDGDAGGVEICSKLRSGGIPASDIFNLGSVLSDCTLEDLVDPGVLAGAINQELDTWNIGPFRVTEADLPETQRWSWLLEQGVSSGTALERLSKPRVAQRVVDIGRDARTSGEPQALLMSTTATKMQKLHRRLSSALGLA